MDCGLGLRPQKGFIPSDTKDLTRYSVPALPIAPIRFLHRKTSFSTLAVMIDILGTSHHWKLAFVLGLCAAGSIAPALAQQSPLLAPSVDDQVAAQQAPATAIPQVQPQPLLQEAPAVPAPSQNQLGIRQTGAPASGSAVIDQMRARAQAERGTTPQENTAAAAGTGGDALPAVTSNIRVKTDGMDYLASDTADLQIRDIPLDTNSEEYQQSIRDEAFSAAADGMFPLSTNEIRELLRRYDETRRAVETPHYEIPKPEVKVETVSLDPGVTPPVINTAVGHVTTLTMLDVTGAPWPIQDVTWAGDFEVVEPEEGGHIVRITPMANFAYGNISMRLLTLKTPITLTLRTTRDTVQYRFDARIPEYGPLAEAQLIDGGGNKTVAGDKVLTQILDGVTPENAERLDVSGVDGRTTALLIGGTTYLRTPLTLLSPAWDSSVKSADGMNVYAMADTPVVLLSDAGTFRRATLRAREGLFDE